MAKKSKRQIEHNEQLYELISLVTGTFSLQDVLNKLAEAAVRIAGSGVKACSIRLLDEEAGDLKMRSTFGLSEKYRDKGVVSKNDTVIKAAFSGEAIVLDDMRVDGRVKYPEAARKEELVSQLTVAMQFREKSIGVLRLYSPKPKHFDEDDIGLARAVASQCAVAITNARLYAKAIEGTKISEQMRLAGVIQRRMIPAKAPAMQGLDIAAAYIPCFDVGGDLYDLFKLDDDRLVVTIADVIGKGIPAAIMMSLFRGAVRAYADCAECRYGMIDIIKRLNRMACREYRDGEFVSLFYAVIDSKARQITCCNCGHEPTVLIRNGRVTDLRSGGLVLGVEADAEYQTQTVDLQQGDCLLFYTDGLIDAADFEGRFWGRENMLEAAKKFADNNAESMLKNVLAYRRRFVGLANQIDDTSVVIIKVG